MYPAPYLKKIIPNKISDSSHLVKISVDPEHYKT